MNEEAQDDFEMNYNIRPIVNGFLITVAMHTPRESREKQWHAESVGNTTKLLHELMYQGSRLFRE